jgi:hypothetical protein
LSLQVTGKPSAEDVDAIDSPFAPTMMESCTINFPKKLSDMFPGASPEALDLMRWVQEVKGGLCANENAQSFDRGVGLAELSEVRG